MNDFSATPDTSARFFEDLYRQGSAGSDPWNFATSPYELFRYDRILAALAGQHFSSAFEPGCSVGVLTARLAPLSDILEAIDFAPTAIAEARRHCADLPNVTLRCLSLPDWVASPPRSDFDLLVLSEIGYYFTAAEWSALATALIEPLPPGATILAVHWLGQSSDHRLSGDAVHNLLATVPGIHPDLSERFTSNPDPRQRFRLDRWRRNGQAGSQPDESRA